VPIIGAVKVTSGATCRRSRHHLALGCKVEAAGFSKMSIWFAGRFGKRVPESTRSTE
jgi:hypothetical protein